MQFFFTRVALLGFVAAEAGDCSHCPLSEHLGLRHVFLAAAAHPMDLELEQRDNQAEATAVLALEVLIPPPLSLTPL